MLTINNLKVQRKDKTILNINKKIDIANKDKVAVLGENGAGKSTLVNAILGAIQYDGEIVRNFKKNEAGIVFQDNAYSSLIKVQELVDLVLPNQQKSVTDFLAKYELEDSKKKYVDKLSGGEKQRLTLGLVLESRKSIYFFDELTSGLDYKKRLKLLNLMREQTADAVVLNVTHYFDEIENWATKILLLNKGRLLFFGDLPAFFTAFNHYSVVKVEYDELVKVDKQAMSHVPSVDTGDGTAFVCRNPQIQVQVEATLNDNEVTYKIMKQNIYTTYSVANAAVVITDQPNLEVGK
jgi:ABC-2 type transport system ATP-binding protein